MTFKEKLQKEHPEFVSAKYFGGCACCPHTYGYESEDNKPCGTRKISCRECWNREIPEPKKHFIYSESTEKVAVGDIIEVHISSKLILSGKRVISAEYPNLVLEDVLGDQTIKLVIYADRIKEINLLMKSTERVKDLVWIYHWNGRNMRHEFTCPKCGNGVLMACNKPLDTDVLKKCPHCGSKNVMY